MPPILARTLELFGMAASVLAANGIKFATAFNPHDTRSHGRRGRHTCQQVSAGIADYVETSKCFC